MISALPTAEDPMNLEMITIHDAIAEARVRVRALSLASASLEDDGERDGGTDKKTQQAEENFHARTADQDVR